METVKGEKEKVSAEGGDGVECCGADGEVVEGEKEKEKVDVTPSGSVGGASSECGGIQQMSRETLRNIRKHLGDGRGECCSSVVVYKCC